jgi:metabolite-proton symporter
MEPQQRKRMLRRAVIASAVGTAIEWYDFFLYGVAAALVFPERFFPQSDPYIGTLLAFSTFFVGFLSRPLGAAIFGHYGDRIGRKASLIATLLLMGVATIGIGLVPDYHSIGIWGAVLLTFGRLLQGIGVGGEWGGSVLLAAEWGEKKNRGFIASWPQWGAPVGLVLANGALSSMTLISGDAFLDWGWRVPFLMSIVLVGVGFWIRVGILETPVFAEMVSQGRVERAPVVKVLQHNWREVLLTALLRTSQQSSFYIFTTFVLTYATKNLGVAKGSVLTDVMIAAMISMISIPLWGWVSDRVGRRKLIAIGCVIMLIWPFAYFSLLDTRSALLIFVAIALAQPIHDLQYGPQAAVIAESFPDRLRYSGSSLGYQLASITAGGPAPIIAIWLLQTYQTSTAIAVYLAVASVVSLLALYALSLRRAHDLEGPQDVGHQGGAGSRSREETNDA